MARGWESKSVEEQLDLARASAESEAKTRLSADQAERLKKLETLRLQRTSVVQQLERAANPRYREMLQRDLAALDQAIADLQPASS